ncbi:MAG: DNA methyltransferase, partial [Fimbriimonadaceae bacterium]
GGRVGFEKVRWFNGGLFDGDLVFPLTKDEIRIVHKAASAFWGDVEPSILGTLFERGLDPNKRSQEGSHYTDLPKIMMIVNPVIVEPLTAEWEAAKAQIVALMSKAEATSGGPATRARGDAQTVLHRYLKRLTDYRVLDPACGSGAFLYVALKVLKDLEHRAQVEAEALGLPRQFPVIGPEVVLGIELNSYAAELARVAIWIGEIQWMIRNGFAASDNPILKPLDNIECRDALVSWQSGSEGSAGQWIEATWPVADVIIGNPPFLGNKKMVRELGEAYVERIRGLFASKLPRAGDLVCFWFAKAWEQISLTRAVRVGLVATNSIRAGSSNDILKSVVAGGRIFAAFSDEPWVVEGAAVRVSLICFDTERDGMRQLDGTNVALVNPDLTGRVVDVSSRATLPENLGLCFVGVILNGDFEVSDDVARNWLRLPTNVNGRPNSDVLRPTLNGDDFNGIRPKKWVVDFGTTATEYEAAMYEEPFRHVLQMVKPYRQRRNGDGSFAVRAVGEREVWWRHARSRPAMRKAMVGLSRYIASPMVSSYRTFDYLPQAVLPDQKLVVFARDDLAFLGILHSHVHHVWTLATCSWIGAGNDITYSNTSVFETFAFPEGLSPNVPASEMAIEPRAIAVANAAEQLIELRENWLHPADLVTRGPEVVMGYPERVLPKDEDAAEILKTRTLTRLYNERPAWLDHAHKALDTAVANAYGWPTDLGDDEVLARLFALNQERSAS